MPCVLRHVSQSMGKEIQHTVLHVKERSAGFSMIHNLLDFV